MPSPSKRTQTQMAQWNSQAYLMVDELMAENPELNHQTAHARALKVLRGNYNERRIEWSKRAPKVALSPEECERYQRLRFGRPGFALVQQELDDAEAKDPKDARQEQLSEELLQEKPNKSAIRKLGRRIDERTELVEKVGSYNNGVYLRPVGGGATMLCKDGALFDPRFSEFKWLQGRPGGVKDVEIPTVGPGSEHFTTIRPKTFAETWWQVGPDAILPVAYMTLEQLEAALEFHGKTSRVPKARIEAAEALAKFRGIQDYSNAKTFGGNALQIARRYAEESDCVWQLDPCCYSNPFGIQARVAKFFAINPSQVPEELHDENLGNLWSDANPPPAKTWGVVPEESKYDASGKSLEEVKGDLKDLYANLEVLQAEEAEE